MLIVKNLVKTYYTKGGVTTKALDDVSINFPETGMIFLLGKSGSGKSTLLNMIGGLDRPDSGEIIVKGKSSKDFSTIDFDSYRNTFIGFIFQEYNILNEFNVEQNIALALQLQGKKADKDVIVSLLKEVDLVGLEKRKPNTLSGGQKQRIAIARALIKEPQIIMADEPTGALDSNTGKQVFDTLKKLSAKKLVIIVSHDREFAQQYGDRIVELKDGKIISDESKVYQEAKKISENVNLVNTNIIQIKNATKLTAKDNKAILDALKKQKGEVLISSGDNEVRNVKKALKINENGKSETFDNTKEVKVNQYDASQTTFIKSKMPFWRAFKIGVSGLKVKPFRLIMTILLSTASFAMFGVASTLMLYNPNYSIREAMRNVDYKTETINKKYKYKYQNIVIDYETGDTQTKNTSNEMTDKTLFGENELKELNNNSTGLKFAGMFNFADSRYGDIGTFSIEGLNITDETVDYFASENVKFSGFSDCGEDYMKSQGFSNCYNGTYPDEVNEIAISDYIANAIIQGNVLKDSKVSQPKDLVNKKITVSGGAGKGRSFKEELTITGVYHIADIPNTYDSLKTARNTSSQSADERNKIKTGMTNFLNGGFFRIAFVSNGFYDAHKDLVVPPTFQNDIPSINLKGIHFDYTYPSDFEVNSETWESAYDYDYIKESSSMQYYDINTGEKVSTKDVKLEQGQAIVSQSIYNELIRRSIGKYGCIRDQFNDMINILSSCQNHVESTVVTNIEDVKETYYEHYREILDNYGTYDAQFYEAYNEIKDCLNDHYNYLQYLNYGYTLNSNSIIDTITTKYSQCATGDKWNNFKTSLQKFNSTSVTITTYDINNIHNYVYEYINKIPELQLPLFRYIGEKICNYAGVQYNNEIYSKDGNIGYQELVSNLYSIERITPEFKAKTKELSAKIYSTAIDLDDKDSYFPDDRSAFNPRYEFKAVYFYKTWDSSLGVQTLNVDYYYENSQGNYSTPIVNHELVNTYIADKNVWLSNIVTTYEAPSDAKYNSLMTVSNYSDNQIDVMIKDYGNYLYEMNNATYQQMSIMIQLVNQFKQIFLYVGIGTGVLAALLFANFISASINNKKKDIGILRAVGAKSTDVFKVFWSESGVIALICFVLAAISAAITCASLNNVIVGTLINIKVLNFSIVNILIILGASILISLLATLIPVIIAAKKPPVEAIRSL